MTSNGHNTNGQKGTEKQNSNSSPWLKPYHFQPGQSGNPAGRPKGTGLTDMLISALGEEEDGKTAGRRLVDAAVSHALRGDFRFWDRIYDRVEGPIRQQLDQTIQRIAVEFEGRASMLEGEDEDE